MNKRRLTQKQLNIYVTPEWHTLVKMQAAERNVSIQMYIMQAIKMRIELENKINGKGQKLPEMQ